VDSPKLDFCFTEFYEVRLDDGGFLAGLLWNYHLTSLGTLLTLWAVLGASFGALCERANCKEAAG
jgi:hypothetical protein